MVKKAIIPAAGYGTRNLPITKVIPKEMFPVAGRPMIHWIVEEAVRSGIEEILIVVSRGKNVILDYFDRSLELEAYLEGKGKTGFLKKLELPEVHIQYVRQPYAKGLGDAVGWGERFAGNEPFAVLLPDDFIISKKPALRQLIDVYKAFQTNTLALARMPQEVLSNYGVIQGEQAGPGLYRLTDIIEKPQADPPSDLAVAGRYILNPGIFHYLKQVRPDAGGELQLTDAMKDMLEIGACYGVELEGERFDIGREEDYVKAVLKLRNGDNKRC